MPILVPDPANSDGELKMAGIIQVINKNGPEGVHFTDRDVKVLEKFCNAIGPAVDKCQSSELTGENLRKALHSLRKQMLSMRASRKAVRLVAPKEHLERLVDEAVSTAQSLLQADRSALWFVDQSRGELWTKFASQIAPIRIGIATGIVGAVASTKADAGDVVNVADAYADPRFNQDIDKATGYTTRSVLSAAVRSTTGELVAVIQVINKKKEPAAAAEAKKEEEGQKADDKFDVFTDTDVQQLGEYCKQLGPAVEHILELDMAREVPASALKTLTLEVAAMKAQLFNTYEGLFLQGNRTACELLNGDRATVWMVDAATNELFSKVADGVPVIRIPNSESSVVGWCVSKGELVNVPDAYADSRFNKDVDAKTGYKTDTILCCPVRNEIGVVIGAVQVINKLVATAGAAGKKHFTDFDEVILESLCQHMRLAFENCISGDGGDGGDGGDSAGGGRDVSNNGDGSGGDSSSKESGSDYVVNMRLSTEALLRFELAHTDVKRANSSNQVLAHDVDISSDSGSNLSSTDSSGVDSSLINLSDQGASKDTILTFDSQGRPSSSNLAAGGAAGKKGVVRGATGDAVDNLLVQPGDVLEELPRRRCRCCCCWLPCCWFCSRWVDKLHEWAKTEILHLTKKPIVYFTKDDSPEELNTAIRYMLANEQRRWIKFVRVFPDDASLPEDIPSVYRFLEYAYPEILIQYTAMVGSFGPPAIRAFSYHMHVPTTFMFMGSFSDKFEFSFTELGGLRLITDNFVSTVAPTEIVEKRVDKRAARFNALLTRMEEEVASKGTVGAGTKNNGGGSDAEEGEDIIQIGHHTSWVAGGESTLTKLEAKKIQLELAKRNIGGHSKK